MIWEHIIYYSLDPALKQHADLNGVMEKERKIIQLPPNVIQLLLKVL